MSEKLSRFDHIQTQEKKEISESKIGDSKFFMEDLKKRMKSTTPEDIHNILSELERYSQTRDRKIEIYTDPKLDTFCCGQVDSEKVTLDGKIVKDPNNKTYLIGIPFIYIAGRASNRFLRGEIRHERGHAEKTDFGRMERFQLLAKKEGYNPRELMELDNCIEDSRMERIIGGPKHENERKQFFEKNSKLIIPNIAEGIRSENGVKMSPTDQFKFIIKLEKLWEIHRKDLEGEEKPWNFDDLHPEVKKAYEKIEPIISKITGDSTKPAMKVNPKVEKLIIEEIWPVYKELIDKYPKKDENKKKENREGGDESEGEDLEETPVPSEGKEGEPSEGKIPPIDIPLDPKNPKSWPPEIQNILKKMEKEHKKRLEEEAEKKKKQNEDKEKNKKNVEKERHKLLKLRDGFDDPKKREKYQNIKNEVAPAIGQIKRIFERFLPKVDESQYEYGKKGIRFNVKRMVKKYGTDHEKPLGRRRRPEKNALLLQILLDVSGSMYDGKRINNATKAIIATCEATQGYNIDVEILANDNKNIDDDNKYEIKSFNDKYGGKTKSKIADIIDGKGFKGDNQDANAMRAAMPRLKKKIQNTKAHVDRVGSLAIYISDSTTESNDTKETTEEYRQFTPFEGTAITNEGSIPAKVRYHFGKNSIIPKSVDEFPAALQEILQRNISKLKPRE